MTSKSLSGHDKQHQNQASKKSNDLSKYLRPRQIPVKVDFWRQLYESQVHSNTTNSVKIKHRRQAMTSKRTVPGKTLKIWKFPASIFLFKTLIKICMILTFFVNLKAGTVFCKFQASFFHIKSLLNFFISLQFSFISSRRPFSIVLQSWNHKKNIKKLKILNPSLKIIRKILKN